MESQKHRGIHITSLNPKFLHTMSTGHTWPFSAIAELIDNACDPDVHAKQFWIDVIRIKGLDCLSFMDNGTGMTRARLEKMFSFGCSEKKTATDAAAAVPVDGNGFKSGSMRLGKDAIVFTKTRETISVGMLSRSYLQAIKAKKIEMPILTFRRDERNLPEDAASLDIILRHSLFSTEKQLFSELRAICAVSTTGTRIIIWNLHTNTNGETEFDFDTFAHDILIRANASERTTESQGMKPESDYSLRAYCSILYLKPHMQINIRGQRVKTQLIFKSLASMASDYYRPSFLSKNVPITFGLNTKSTERYGIMMYHKNRLIKAYEKVSCQRKAERTGVGVIGVIECNFLQPKPNKQDFEDTDLYRNTLINLSVKLEQYWNVIQCECKKGDPKSSVSTVDKMKVPDQVWVQCDSCLKWRRLPDGFNYNHLPKKWLCNMNHEAQFRGCLVEEELEDHEEEKKSYPKAFKRQKKNSTSLKEERMPMASEELETPPIDPSTSTIQAENTVSSQPFVSYLSTNNETDLRSHSPATAAQPESSSSPAQKCPLPLINSLSHTLKRVKWKLPVTEMPPAAKCVVPLPPPALPQGVKQKQSASGTSPPANSVMSLPPAAIPQDRSPTVTAHSTFASDKEESQWKGVKQEELMEMMREAEEERDACRVQLDMLQKHCAVLDDDCRKLESRLEMVENEKLILSQLCDREVTKLRTLRLNLGRLLAHFTPALDLQHVDLGSDFIDQLIQQALEVVV